MVRSIKAKMMTHVYQRCMACVDRAMHDLDEHRAYLESLDQTLLVMQQSLYTTTCLNVYSSVLRDLGITSFQQTSCECTSQENSDKSYPDDIVITRVGQVARDHFFMFTDGLLKEINRKEGTVEKQEVQRANDIHDDVVKRFWDVVEDLTPGETLVSHQRLTRGYRLEFDGLTEDALKDLQGTN